MPTRSIMSPDIGIIKGGKRYSIRSKLTQINKVNNSSQYCLRSQGIEIDLVDNSKSYSLALVFKIEFYIQKDLLNNSYTILNVKFPEVRVIFIKILYMYKLLILVSNSF